MLGPGHFRPGLARGKLGRVQRYPCWTRTCQRTSEVEIVLVTGHRYGGENRETRRVQG